ncbi:hypothetical protein SPBR_05205 [Sporothrix brasiliensis 5110]|uniref:F-box domain-containing protein n=1 Tax=Sporothrix brasiliensis 5110 TaxID=1398154 RepID=A0A0C2IKL2_9PEZI|nr:uncharacterized protein SPBR_05205 [Sporothrix brasiliensis 5110]KIH87515.1 hypothetical protein SPBR_05205 [Sporothrix brasiliensis 5110]
MDFFHLPVEIRLQIYSELLVHRGTITFHDASNRVKGDRVCTDERIHLDPTVLRANKRIHSEAISLLYSDNHYRFVNCLVTFVEQVGNQAHLLRHVVVDFPNYMRISHRQPDHSWRYEEILHLDEIYFLQRACPGITTLGLSLDFGLSNLFSPDTRLVTQGLDLIHTQLKELSSLSKVTVHLHLIGCDSDDDTEDEAEYSGDDDPRVESNDPTKDRWQTHRDSIVGQLSSRGWVVDITKSEPPKQIWSTPDDMLEFDNEDEYNEYMIEWNRREQEREDAELRDYYRELQLESYRKGYADDGGPA